MTPKEQTLIEDPDFVDGLILATRRALLAKREWVAGEPLDGYHTTLQQTVGAPPGC